MIVLRWAAIVGIAALLSACASRSAGALPGGRPHATCSRIIDDARIGSKPDEFSYRGAWRHIRAQRTGPYRGTSSRSSSVGDLVALSFEGSCVMIHGIVGPHGGPATLAIDGELKRLNFRAARGHRALVYSNLALSDGLHNIVIVVGDGSRAASSRGYVNIDDAVVSR